jgi:GNAT superfamily N-acetyltransferase
MDEVIARADYETVRALAPRNQSLTIRPQDEFFVLSVGGAIVSMLSVSVKGRRAKIKANYTRPECRRRGHFSRLLAFIVATHRDHELVADCLDASLGVYLAAGFRVRSRKAYRRFTLTRVHLGREELSAVDGQARRQVEQLALASEDRRVGEFADLCPVRERVVFARPPMREAK